MSLSHFQNLRRFLPAKILRLLPVSVIARDQFDAAYYTGKYSNIGPHKDPFKHFAETGWRLGYDPNNWFSTSTYLDLHSDVRAAGVNPFFHYLQYGKEERRQIRPASQTARAPSPRDFNFSDLLEETTPSSAPPLLEEVSVVVPIYNNLDDVKALLESLEKTLDNSVRVILVNDKSPDERILPLLSSWISRHPTWHLLDNKENLGFAETVNRGIEISSGHVVVLNSDVVLPQGWLERLIRPFTLYPDEIGAVTPFSNHSSLTGFPEPRNEVPLTSLGSLEQIDDAFRSLRLRYVDMPAAVGFCLAMNRATIDKIGRLDAASYGRGYYEDTDWSQRAIAAGFRVVACGNLFIHHKVESQSFSVEKRIALSEQNRAVFLKKFPFYAEAERKFYDTDPLRDIRIAARTLVWRKRAKSAHLVVNHSWGGGAADFARELADDLLKKDALVIELVLSKNQVQLSFSYRDERAQTQQPYADDIWKIMRHYEVGEIVLNAIHGSDQPRHILRLLAASASTIPMTVYLHDFLAVCPSIFLLTNDNRFCGVPELGACQVCYFSNRNLKYSAPNIVEWRRDWNSVLSRAKRLVVFSRASKEILLKAYSSLDAGRVEVATTHYTPPVRPVSHKPNSIRFSIGVIGAMHPHKGSQLVATVARYIHQAGKNARMTLIGHWHDPRRKPKLIVEMGAYTVDRLPAMIENNSIDVILFPSVCPETYSRTLTEIFAMEMPVVSLNIGAQGERVGDYKYGVVSAGDDPAAIFTALEQAMAKKWAKPDA